MKTTINVPIYNATVYLIISDDVFKERKKMDKVFGSAQADDFEALTSSADGVLVFGLFFRKNVSMSTVAHEVFHLTHRILEWTNCYFSVDEQEQAALLNGYLMDIVIKKINNAVKNCKI